MTRVAPPLLALAAAVVLLHAPPAGARAGKDDPEARVVRSCGGGVSSELRLRARDGRIELRFEVDHAGAGSAWRVALVQERRVVWKAIRRGRSFEVRRTLRDLPGADTVTASAWGPRGLVCRTTATLSGS